MSIGDNAGRLFPAGPRDAQLVVLRAVCDALAPDWSVASGATRIADYAGRDADTLRRARARLERSVVGATSAVARRALSALEQAIVDLG